MKISIEVQDEFIPTWRNNKEEDNPIVISHLEPTLALYNKLVPKAKLDMKFDKDFSITGGGTVIEVDNTKFVKAMVTKIKNLSYEKNGKEYKIETADDLLGPGVPATFAGLVDEVGTYLNNVLNQRFDAKN